MCPSGSYSKFLDRRPYFTVPYNEHVSCLKTPRLHPLSSSGHVFCEPLETQCVKFSRRRFFLRCLGIQSDRLHPIGVVWVATWRTVLRYPSPQSSDPPRALAVHDRPSRTLSLANRSLCVRQPQGQREGAGAEDDLDNDVNSDSELQEIYVQAYACQFFRDDDAAQAVEDGAHLRPLAVPQVTNSLIRWQIP